ncbi:uncharacterized protein [Euphorbia lathyris]|uniref:uncharacterized protein n=1 Tax=Euphorbia lathyris TaxID=212925 RepID=UPI00331310DB
MEKSIYQNSSPIPISSSPHSEGHQNRKHGQFESDCESIGDNFEFFLKHRTNQEMPYIWTDERLQLLVTKFYDYVHKPFSGVYTCSTGWHLQLLETLKDEPLILANDEAPDTPLQLQMTLQTNWRKLLNGMKDLTNMFHWMVHPAVSPLHKL